LYHFPKRDRDINDGQLPVQLLSKIPMPRLGKERPNSSRIALYVLIFTFLEEDPFLVLFINSFAVLPFSQITVESSAPIK